MKGKKVLKREVKVSSGVGFGCARTRRKDLTGNNFNLRHSFRPSFSPRGRLEQAMNHPVLLVLCLKIRTWP